MKLNPTPSPRSRFGLWQSLLAAALALALGAVAAHAEPAWNPGHYMLVYRGDSRDAGKLSNRIEELASLPNIKGIKAFWNWSDIENDAGGTYDWSAIEAALNHCAALGKHLVVQIDDRIFGGGATNANARNMLPDYLIDDPAYGGGWYPIASNTGVSAKIYLTPVADRYIAMMKDMAQHFNALPNIAYLEAVYAGTGESAVSNPSPGPDYSDAAFVTQRKRIGIEMVSVWPNTTVIQPLNFIPGSLASYTSFMQHIEANRLAIGGPDIFSKGGTVEEDLTTGQETLVGLSGGVDYRGRVPVMFDVQHPDFTAEYGAPLPAAVYQRANETLHCSHIFWIRFDTPGKEAQNWTTGIVPFINSINGATHTEKPLNYGGGTAPAAPSGLTAMADSPTQINLAWSDNSANETGFVVERADNAAFTAELVATTTAANVTTFASVELSASTLYYYRVRAVNGVGASVDSNAASAITAVPGAVAPEINLQGHGGSIADGDATPAATDDTDFGPTLTGGALSRTFTIQNSGTAPLAIGTVTLAGLNSADFAITAQPATTVAVGESTTLAIRFVPGVAGVRAATVTIPNDDADENPYNFAIKGTGGSSMQFELENFFHSKSANDPHQIRTNPDDVLLQANADGDFLLFEIPGVPAGRCNIKVIVQTGPNRAIFQLESSESPSGPFDPHGAPIDTFASGFGTNTTKTVATDVMFATSGPRFFRFRITGRNAASSGRALAVDALQLARPSATITLTNLSQVYDGTARSPTFTTSPAGLAVSATYNGNAAAVNAGTYAVVATIADPNYTGSASGTFTIAPAAATATLDNLAQTYDGAPRVVTMTTNPAGVGTRVTYAGSETPPTEAGSYAVVAAIADPNYVGDPVSGTLTIGKATAVISLGSLQAVYDGAPHAVTATTTPAGLAVSVTYNGSSIAPTAADTYPVAATVNEANYSGTAPGTLTIAKRAVALDLAGLRQAYNGEPRAVTATTPDGLTVVVTYDGSTTPPANPGAYAVEASIVDANNSGTVGATLVITITALVRHAPSLNAEIDGSMQVLLGEGFALNSGAMVSGDILVPGTPAVQQNGHPTFAGTLEGRGNATPSNYQVTLNGNAVLRHLVRRTDPIALPVVAAPPSPTGTRNVSINSAGQSPGDFATLRNLTLNGNVGQVPVPAGTYGSFTANGSSGFTLGVAGATTPAVYDLQGLTLNGASRLEVVGPVIVNLASGGSLNGNVGDSDHPAWLALNVASGNVTLNGNVTFRGDVVAPNGTVTINGSSTLTGKVACDRLTINGNGLLSEP